MIDSSSVIDSDTLTRDESVDTASDNQSEVMVPQSKVNELVGLAKKKAYEKAIREVEARSNMQQQPTSQEVNNNAFDEKVFEEKAREIAAREFEQMQAQKMRQDFHQDFARRIKDGKTGIDNFDTVTRGFDFDKYEAEMFLASQFPDTARIVTVLASDPDKLDRINSALARGNSDLAYKLMESLQKSISANVEAENAQKLNKTPEPLSQLKPSAGTSGDGGDLTLEDMKKMFLG